MGKTAPSPLAFEPLDIRGVHTAHRLWVAPMCMYSAVDGVPQPWHLAHLGSFAIGRAGLITTEATAVSPEGRITPTDTGIWNEDQAAAWAEVVDFAHSQGVPIAMQIGHAGRKASTRAPHHGRGHCPPEDGGWDTIGPSALPFGRLPEPTSMNRDGIDRIVEAFVTAASRSVGAGFDAVEVHAAHGYLLDEFLSPDSNHRDDDYGGSFENRTRLVLRIVREIRSVIPDTTALFVRLSATHWVEGGWSIEDTTRLAPLLEEAGADLLSISSGGNDHRQEVPVRPGYQVPLARAVRRTVQIPVATAGLITSSTQAESLLVDGAADVALVARQFLREPAFSLRAAAELGGHLEWAGQYSMAKYAGSIP